MDAPFTWTIKRVEAYQSLISMMFTTAFLTQTLDMNKATQFVSDASLEGMT